MSAKRGEPANNSSSSSSNSSSGNAVAEVPSTAVNPEKLIANLNAARLLLKGEILQHIIHSCHLAWSETLPTVSRSRGTIYLTNYQLIFLHDDHPNVDSVRMPLTSIWQIKQDLSATETLVTVKCKLAFAAAFVIPNTSGKKAGQDDVARVLWSFVPRKATSTFAFVSQEVYVAPAAAVSASPSAIEPDGIALNPDGWQWFNLKDELTRLLKGSDSWRITELNADFQLCPSYPELVAVPSSITDAELRRVAKFRSSQRFPALSWRHAVNGAAIVRCSQPSVGFKRQRCFEDEKMVCNVRDANAQPGSAARFYIVDARPKANVLANTAIGGGVEDRDFYPNCDVEFLDIPNIHVVRDSYEKMVKVAVGSDHAHFYKELDESGWLTLIGGVLSGAQRIVSIIGAGHSVLTHCTDGWDRTSQLTSLAMLMMDASYRTLTGFACLVEKEWLSFGHKFEQRHGVAEFFDDHEQISPIFLEFLDCVHQLLRQHPTAFEFNSRLLVTIAEESYSCRFGTFLFNTRRHRRENDVARRCQSLWSYVAAASASYTNPFYRPDGNNSGRVLTVQVRVVCATAYSDLMRAQQTTQSALSWWQQWFVAHRRTRVAPARRDIIDATQCDPIELLTAAMIDEREQGKALWLQLDMLKGMIRSLDEENRKFKQTAAAHSATSSLPTSPTK